VDRGGGGLGGKGGGRPARGRRQRPRPAGRRPYGRGEPTPGGRPASRGPVVVRRYAPTGTGLAWKAAVDGARSCSPRAAVDCRSRSPGVSGGHRGAAAEEGQDRRCRRSEGE